MSSSPERIDFLLDRYAAKLHTEAERQELMELLSHEWNRTQLGQSVPGVDWEKMYRVVREEMMEIPMLVPGSRNIRTSILRYAAAAILILALGIGGYFLFFNHSNKNLAQTTNPSPYKNDVAPGKYKARLTLADGSQLVLDSSRDKLLARQGNTKVLKQGGQLKYNAESNSPMVLLYNTLSTAKGEMYPLVLSDGTRVWLNAASSIRFPVAFSGKERNVSITGEAYFEVAHNLGKPFQVQVNGMEVRVLGTHFNINSYEDENAVKTTLLEGRVLIRKGGRESILKPGQQAQLGKNGRIEVINNSDLEEAVAWKNGYYKYNSSDIQTLMRQAARWYGVEVVYGGKIPADRFTGKISRTVNLSEWLKVLEYSGVRFNMDGKKLTVLP